MRLRSGNLPVWDSVVQAAAEILEGWSRPHLRRVINASGVVIHTNLGRSLLADEAVDRVVEVARGYSTLEYDLASGTRGSRHDHVEALLCRLTGAQGAMVVNNNAGAVLLMLSALAAGREVIVSRGQLVEIGGSFRIPDIMRLSGARLVEVGTTNKTRLSDYEEAVTDFTRVIELDSTFAAAHIARGQTHAAMGEHRLAIADYDRTLELDPKMATAYSARGRARAAGHTADRRGIPAP